MGDGFRGLPKDFVEQMWRHFDKRTRRAILKLYRATDTDSLQKIYAEINRLETTKQTVQKFEHYDELYPWALYPALAILGLSFLLQQTRYRRLP